jgi:oligoribonuclease NrnB/cAMP/cGMP phosphodiesterase (DHH superfamily)
VDDYDTWRHSDPESMAFHYGIDISTKFQGVINTAQKTEFKASIASEMTVWEDALYSDDNTVYNRYVLPGRYIVAYRKEEFRKTLRRGFEFRLMESYNAFAVNAAGGSDLFGTILDKYDVCIAYWYDGAYDCWRYAVRSGENSEFDCAEFCKKYGGGGHLHAAGFQTEKDVTYEWTND